MIQTAVDLENQPFFVWRIGFQIFPWNVRNFLAETNLLVANSLVFLYFCISCSHGIAQKVLFQAAWKFGWFGCQKLTLAAGNTWHMESEHATFPLWEHLLIKESMGFFHTGTTSKYNMVSVHDF